MTPNDEPVRRAKIARIFAILGAHSVLDAYAMAFPASLVLFEARCGLTPAESAWLLGVGPLCSGLSQPIFAWLSDRGDSRIYTGLGLAVCAIAMCLLGLADGFTGVLILYCIAMIAAGSFHPVSAACAGQLAGRRRSAAASGFFVAGMMGGAIGSFGGPRFLSQPGGFALLPWVMIPGIVVAAMTYGLVARVPHRAPGAHAKLAEAGDLTKRWTMVAVLFLAAAVRFTVNMALIYLLGRWMERTVAAAHPEWLPQRIASIAAPQVGNLVSSSIIGMAIGGLCAGSLVRPGKEKWPMVVVPMLFAPAIWWLPHLQGPATWLACGLAGVGYAAMVPVGLAAGQRLLPHRTSLASGLMLGGAWTISLLGPRLAQWGLDHVGLHTTFECVAVALATSGVLSLLLSQRLLQSSVESA